MKIAIICQNYPPSKNEGGISHYSRCLAKSLSAIGDDITIITGGDYFGTGLDGFTTVASFTDEWNYRTIKNIIIYLKNRKIDIVNIQYSPVMYSPIFKLAWHKFAKNFIMITSLHTLWGGPKFNYLIALFALFASHRIIATNSEILYLIKKYFPFFKQKSFFIPIGPNIKPESTKSNHDTVAAKYALDPNLPVISYFGMSYQGKGMELLLNTTRLLERKYKLQFQLLIIGGGISDDLLYIENRKALTSKFNIKSNVIWTGRISSNEVSTLLDQSQAIILPYKQGVSDRRGSLMVALAHKRAVVTTKPAVPVSLFKNGKNMIWPATQDTNSLALIVYSVLTDDALRQRLENGASDLAKHFEWSNIAKETHSCFKIILESCN